MFEFVAVTRSGEHKPFRTYAEACEWLDATEPSERGFTIEELEGADVVRHAD